MELVGRVRTLDGLRTVAVLLVFATHSVAELVPGGFIGVDVFFVLSGFLITGLLAAEWSHMGTIHRRAFYGRRALRLYPALLFALVGVAMITPLVGHGWATYGRDSVTSLSYTYNIFRVVFPNSATGPIGHFWSLCVEEQYYVIWPLVLLWLLRRGGPATAIKGTLVGIIGTALLKAGLVPLLTTGRLYFLPFGHADELLVGSLLGMLLLFRPAPWLHRIVGDARVAWLCPLPLVAVALTARIQTTWLYLGGLLGMAILTSVIVAHLVVAPTSVMARLLTLAPLQWLGLRSYAFYLLHQPVIIALRAQGLPYRILIPLALGVTCALCAASWPIERYVLRRLKHRFQPTTTRATLAEG